MIQVIGNVTIAENSIMKVHSKSVHARVEMGIFINTVTKF